MQAYHARLTKLLSGDDESLIHSDIEKASLDSVAEALGLSKGQVPDTVNCCVSYYMFCAWYDVTVVAKTLYQTWTDLDYYYTKYKLCSAISRNEVDYAKLFLIESAHWNCNMMCTSYTIASTLLVTFIRSKKSEPVDAYAAYIVVEVLLYKVAFSARGQEFWLVGGDGCSPECNGDRLLLTRACWTNKGCVARPSCDLLPP